MDLLLGSEQLLDLQSSPGEASRSTEIKLHLQAQLQFSLESGEQESLAFLLLRITHSSTA